MTGYGKLKPPQQADLEAMKTTEQDLRKHFIGEFSDLKQQLNGEQALEIKELRAAAIQAFEQKGFPLGKDEELSLIHI